MIFAELPLAEVEGAMLAHSLSLGGRRHAKGQRVDAALIAAARSAGIGALWVARPEPGDVPEDEAAAALGEALAGGGVQPHAPTHGRVNLHATVAGLLDLAPEAICGANAAGDLVGLSTLPPHTPVMAGELVATVKVMPYALPAEALRAAMPAQPIRVLPWRKGLGATLIQTRLAATLPKLLAKTADVTRARLMRLGVELAEAEPVAHAVDALSLALQAEAAPLLLIAGAAATSDRRDVIPAALVAAGGEVLRVGMPVDPGNLLVLGRLGDATVIGLPGCARSPRRNGLDLVLERWAAGLPLSAEAIGAMGVGGLLDGGGRPVPWGGRG